MSLVDLTLTPTLIKRTLIKRDKIAILPLTTMASSSKGVDLENPARLRRRQHQGFSHTPSLTSENNQSDEPAAEIYQSAVSDLFF